MSLAADLRWMPPAAPLPQPVQDLAHPHHDRNAPLSDRAAPRSVRFWRAMIFAPAAMTTVALLWAFADWLRPGGITPLEATLIALVGTTFFWICFAVGTATVGLVRLYRGRNRPEDRAEASAMTVALLVPIYNEVPWDVFGNAAAMVADLRDQASKHAFSLFILSDTQDPAIAAQEHRAMAHLVGSLPEGTRVHYRRRLRNTERKTGNLSDWIECWGGGNEAMIVLDADSLMSGAALVQLTDALALDPGAGLIQSSPRLIGAETFFGRVQQFSAGVYGALLAEGLAAWTAQEGNYWGHNAILRTAAFAACAGLPRMPSRRGDGDLILSHDFVEAGLLRRAGWSVRFLPRIEGSYEEAPATLIDYALRDRRWCHGNLQHLRLLRSRGFHPVSRFHLFHGAMSYLLAPLWFALLVIWAVLGNGADSVINYFSDSNPLYPIWPDLSRVSSVLILVFMYGMLLAPKLMAAAALPLTGLTPAKLGGWPQLLMSMLIEITASILLAPILMVQQVIAVARTLLGVKAVWAPAERQGRAWPLRVLLRFHAVETVTGALLVAGMILGAVSLWMLPIAVSLLGAVPLSALSRFEMSRSRLTRHQMATPEHFEAPGIFAAAQAERAAMRALLTAPAAAAE